MKRGVRKDRESAIMETIARRPCTLEDLQVILGMHVNELNKYLGILEINRKIKRHQQGSLVFYEKQS